MKKVISLLLCIATLLCFVTACGEDQEDASAHKHCICGGKLEGHSCEKTEFQPLNKASFENVTAESAPVKLHNDSVYRLDPGCYYLEEEIAVNEQVLIFDEVTVCLNGKRLAGTHSLRTGVYSRIFAVSGGTLNICDCCAETGEGNIQGSYVNQGGAILIQGRGGGPEGDPGTVNLYSGIIKGGRAQSGNGGTVSVIGGTFRVYDGQITGGAAKLNGGNIYVGPEQTLELYGGVITDGLANFGSCIYAETGAKLILGGKVAADGLYLCEDTTVQLSQEYPVAEGFCVPVTMAQPGVFASGITSDLSRYFPGSQYDSAAGTLTGE